LSGTLVRHDRLGDTLGRAWFPASVALIAAATLAPQAGSSNIGQDFFAPLAPQGWADAIVNVLLYVPFGLLAGLRGITWPLTVLASATLSLVTELLQFLVPGRNPAATDIIANAFGAFVAFAIARTRSGAKARDGLVRLERWLARGLRPAPRVASRLSLVWAAIVFGVATGTSWLLTPALTEPFFLLSSPLLDAGRGLLRIGSAGEQLGTFRGLIDDVRIYSSARSAESIRADMNTPVSTASSEPDLVAGFGFDSDEGGITSSATGRQSAMVRAATWTPSGRFGGALIFDGRASSVIVPYFTALDLRRTVTIEAWVNPAERQDTRAPVVAHNGSAYFLRTSSPSGVLVPSGGGTFGGHTKEARSRVRIPAHEWTHLAVAYDGRAMRLHINGRPVVRMRHWSAHDTHRATLNGEPLSPGPVASPSALRAAVSGPFSLRLTLRCGALEREAASVFVLVGIQSIEVLNIDAAGTELRVRWSSWARRAGLAPVEYRVPHALSGCATGTTRSFSLKGPLPSLQLFDGDGGTMHDLGPGVGSGWAFLLDSRIMPSRVVASASCVYLALLVLPFGFWARASLPTLVGTLILAGALVSTPKAFGFPPVDAIQAIACAAGAFVGVLARIGTTNRSGRVPS
jgi:hypothetical protein